MRRWTFLGIAMIGVIAAAWISWRLWHSTTTDTVSGVEPDAEVLDLIEQLREPGNKVQTGIVIIPGGELLTFSTPMKSLIRMGNRSRAMLHERINDSQIQNEVVLILGAIGDPTTVPLLIEAYPEDDVKSPGAETKHVCFTFALTYLTGQPIGRTREGADYNPMNRHIWQEWWRQHGRDFVVPVVKPNATWVPAYPVD